MKTQRFTMVPVRLAVLLALGLSAMSAAAVPKTWTGGGDKSSWSDGSNWGGSAPQAGDDVSISIASTVILSSASALLNSFTITNATLVFTNWTTTLNATSVTIQSRGVLTLPPAFGTNAMSNCVHIVCTNFIMDVGSTIDASSRGYMASNGPGRGGGQSSRGGGGSYGGIGGRPDTLQASFPPYGVTNVPLAPGSGGGGTLGILGKGGGVVWIEADDVTINGTVDASGGAGSHLGGGSGGSVYINASGIFGGTTSGLIRVAGGSGSSSLGGGGGGGRMAVNFAALGNPHAVRFNASPGIGYWVLPDWWQRTGQMGTLWLPNTNLLAESIGDDLFTGVLLVLPASTAWTPDSLTISNCSFGFLESGVTVSNDFRMIGGSFSLGIASNPANPQLSCRNLYLTNGAGLHIFSGKTNGIGQSYGALVSVAEEAVVGASCWIYAYSHESDGGAPLFRMSNLVVGALGGFSGNNRGFGAGTGPGKGAGANRGGGGAYGGRGGNSDAANYPGGTPYGSAREVLAPGSGGGMTTAGHGGGLVRIEATNLTVNGTITATGGNPGNDPGGGSGGGISIACATFRAGGGLIQAQGGNGKGIGGGGGGGRIALRYSTLDILHDVCFSASPGTGWVNTSIRKDTWDRLSYMGTLDLPEVSNWLSGTMSGGVFSNVNLSAPGFTNWDVISLTLSNTWLALGTPGFRLTVTNDLRIENGLLDLGVNSSTAMPVLSCGGNLVLTNGAILGIYSGVTNGLAPDEYGALVDVAGDVTLGSASWFYAYSHETNGGSALFRMRNLTVAATNAGFIATGSGFKENSGPGRVLVTSARGGGAGYGGRGGRSDTGGLGGNPYGLTNAPINPGSGGYYIGDAGRGGGAIRIEAKGAVFTRGILQAKGAASWSLGGGGSGGGILIDCLSFSGSAEASLNASGGNGTTSYGGGGGGGRIAVWRGVTPAIRTMLLNGQPLPANVSTSDTAFPSYAGTSSVTNGIGWDTLNAPGTNALPGTVVFLTTAMRGSVIIIR